MASYHQAEHSQTHHLAECEDEQWLRLSPSSSASSILSDECLSSLDSRSSSPFHKQRPSWRFPWPFSKRQWNAKKEDGHGNASCVTPVVQHRSHRRPPPLNIPLNIPLIPTDSTPTASPLSPSWWAAATPPSAMASPPNCDRLLSTSTHCLCNQRVVEKTGCQCGRLRDEMATQTSAYPYVSSRDSSISHMSMNSDKRMLHSPTESKDRQSEPVPGLTEIETNLGRRRSTGDFIQKRWQQDGATDSKEERPFSPSFSEEYSKQRRLMQQKHQYNLYLLGHLDNFGLHLTTPMLSRNNDNGSGRGGKDGMLKPKSLDSYDRDKKAEQKGRGGGGRRGARGVRRRQGWRTTQRWSIVVGVAVILASGAMLVLRLAAYRSEQKIGFSKSGTGVVIISPAQQWERTEQQQHREPLMLMHKLKVPSTDPQPRQEEVYSQDPQQEQIDRLLYRGGGDRWVEDKLMTNQRQNGQSSFQSFASVSKTPASAPLLNQPHSQHSLGSLTSSSESTPKTGYPQAQPQSDPGSLLGFYPDDDEDD